MRYFIDNNSNLANYSQLMNQIKEKIYNHELKENDQLPSIRLLAKELHIAIITVKRAYDELEKEGFVESRQGKGCFVKKQFLPQLLEDKKNELQNELIKIIDEYKKYGITQEDVSTIFKIIEKRENYGK